MFRSLRTQHATMEAQKRRRGWRGLLAIAAVAVLSVCVGHSSAAAKKIALIIGNDTYKEVTPLERAVADARSYKKLLEEGHGFKVIYAENATRRQMLDKIYEFILLHS